VGKHNQSFRQEKTLEAFTSYSWAGGKCGGTSELELNERWIRSNNGMIPNPLPNYDKNAATNPVSASQTRIHDRTPNNTFDGSTGALILASLLGRHGEYWGNQVRRRAG